MKNPQRILLLLFCFVLILSCSKDPISEGADPAGTFLQVQFNQNTVSVTKVDSVIAVFKLPGSANTIRRKMLLKESVYTTTAQDLSPATYSVELNVYLKKEPGVAYSYLYKVKKNIAFPLQAVQNITGPDGKYAGEWSPYFHFRNETKNVTFIIAERVDDPYFEIRMPEQNTFKATLLDRATYGGDNNVGYLAEHKQWITTVNPFVDGVYTNIGAFSNFAENMKTKQWYRCEFSFFIESTTGVADVDFDLNYYPRQ